MDFIVFALIAYLLGSIPTAVWVGKIKYGIDIREHGSKNAGATNTFRILGKKAGITVLFIDIIKGSIAVLIPFLLTTYKWADDYLIYIKITCGIMAVIGHIFPVFAKFKGGKGVATSLGVILSLYPLAALTCIAVFLIVFSISHYVSLGAIISAITFPLSIILIFHDKNIILILFSIVLSLSVIILHHNNIKRLINGTENKMNLFNKKT